MKLSIMVLVLVGTLHVGPLVALAIPASSNL